jgi:hypothetical protein
MVTAFENKTVKEISDLLAGSFQEKFNKSLRLLPKSFIKVISTVFAGVYVTLYKQIGWLFLQIFPETSYWGEVVIGRTTVRPLVKWGVLIGAGEPRGGTQWKGRIRVTVTRRGSQLPAGTQLKSALTGKLYITGEGVTLENETETIPVICAENGTAGNLQTGDFLSFVSPLGVVSRAAEVAGCVQPAVDGETEQEYRARVVGRFRSPPMGGSLSDYRHWACGVPGVLNAYPCKDTETPNGVILYVSCLPSVSPDRVPPETRELLKQAGRACVYDPETGKADRKPLMAVIDPAYNETYANVKPVTIKYFDVRVDGIKGVPAGEFGEAVRPALENYFLGREPYIRGLSDDNNKTNTVSRNNVMSIIDRNIVSIKAEFESVTMLLDGVETAAFTLKTGELAALGGLDLNEAGE